MLAGSATYGQRELELGQRAREVEVVVMQVEHDILVAERERELVGLCGARLEEKPVARTEAAKLRRRRVVDGVTTDEPPCVAMRDMR